MLTVVLLVVLGGPAPAPELTTASYADAVKRLTTALKRAKHADAELLHAEAERHLASAELLEPAVLAARRAELFELLADLRLAQKRADEAVTAYDKALDHATSTSDTRARKRLLGALASACDRAGKSGRAKDVRAAARADQTLAELRRTATSAARKRPADRAKVLRKAEQQLAEIDATYKKARDSEARRQATAVGVRLAALAGDAATARKRASALDAGCPKGCEAMRADAREALAALALEAGDTDAALAAYLLRDHLRSRGQPDEVRRYSRSVEAERLCGAYSERTGDTGCRALERTLTGENTYPDFSRENVGEELKPEHIDRTAAAFSGTVEGCLTAAAERDRGIRGMEYQIYWVVNETGRTEQIELRRVDRRQYMDTISEGEVDPALLGCVSDRMSLWRYPRFRSNRPNLSMSFTVN